MRKTLPLICLAILSSCARAQHKFETCEAGNRSACFSLGKRCARGDAESCYFLDKLSKENRTLAGYGAGNAGPSWMESHAAGIGNALKNVNDRNARQESERKCLESENCVLVNGTVNVHK